MLNPPTIFSKPLPRQCKGGLPVQKSGMPLSASEISLLRYARLICDLKQENRNYLANVVNDIFAAMLVIFSMLMVALC